MNIITQQSLYARNKFLISLTDDYERGLNDRELITYVDQYGDRQRFESIVLNGSHPGHFGGEVERRANDECVVTVYTD